MSGLLALLDDVAAIAKVAAASIDDIATSTVKAGSKTAGIIIDDAAVTPKYVTGLAPARELPIIWRITLGSLRNKILILLPALMLLHALWPAALVPLLMVGGAYLCFEGAEKVIHAVGFGGHDGHGSEDVGDPAHIEQSRISSAVRTDFILSAEIMTLSLSVIEADGLVKTGLVLAAVGVLITLVVYGSVALLVKMDDIGLRLAQSGSRAITALGTGIVRAMPKVFTFLTVVGTAAMLWVGGNIITHGLKSLGVKGPYDAIHHAAEAAAAALPQAPDLAAWLVTAGLDAVIGVVLGAVIVGVVTLAKRLRA